MVGDNQVLASSKVPSNTFRQSETMEVIFDDRLTDIEHFYSIKFPPILFSGCMGDVEGVSANQMLG